MASVRSPVAAAAARAGLALFSPSGSLLGPLLAALFGSLLGACAHRPLICPLDRQRIERPGRQSVREEFCGRNADGGSPDSATPSGWFRETYANGRLRCEGMTHDGKKEGVWRCFHPNGAPMATLPFAAGVREGVSVQRAEDGALESRVSWRNGMFDGELTTYRKDGSVEHRQRYRKGKRHGVSRAYDESGTLIYEANYENGDLVGCARERGSAADPWQSACPPK